MSKKFAISIRALLCGIMIPITSAHANRGDFPLLKSEQKETRIQAEINEIGNAILEQESSFEMILTAGQELNKADTAEKQEFDWQKDLLEIVQPIISELRQLTENKRKLDGLHK